MYHTTCVQDAVGQKTCGICEQHEFQGGSSMFIVLHVAVKAVKQLSVYGLKIFAHDDATSWPHVVHLCVNVVPQTLCVAPKHAHVDFDMYVTDSQKIFGFVVCHNDFFVVF